ncbi:oligosaccharide flippase family protein [Frankia sp. AgPm24]|uniref:lipopolysaccharide biosynthesis protein n=1 Tax=Frankia sp. AgPm24 TaxID=631128 RepID=UPI0020102D48|nr:oligosaccharide flippase family protein [Frankia sp. AgPm24]MCK9925550.1 oligosaccharide flippase family protein [Frankia sp. AgPm24]
MTQPAQPARPVRPARRELVVELLRGPMLLAVAGGVANGLNLVMNLVLARVLDPSGYGAVVVQTNIYLVLAVVGTAVLTAVVRRDLAPSSIPGRARIAWIRRLRAATASMALVAAGIAVVACRPVAALLSYPHPVAIAEAGVAAGLWLAVCVERGLLQARGNYPGLAWNMVYETVLRVAVIIVAACAGLGVDGAGLGLLVGALAATSAARTTVSRTSTSRTSTSRTSTSRTSTSRTSVDARTSDTHAAPDHARSEHVRSEVQGRRTRRVLLADSSVALATLMPLALLQNVDVVLVGWRDPEAAGSYAAISTTCKIPVFVGLAVANYLLAEAARRRREGRTAYAALALAMIIVVVPGLLLSAAGAVAGRPLLSLLFGSRLAAASGVLWVLALATTFLAATLLFATYLLGVGDRGIVWVLAVCTPTSTVVVAVFADEITSTVLALLGCQAGTALLAGILVARAHRPGRPASPRRRAPSSLRTYPSDTPTPPALRGRPLVAEPSGQAREPHLP